YHQGARMHAKTLLTDTFYFISQKWLALLLLVFPISIIWYGCAHYVGVIFEENQAQPINLILAIIFAAFVEVLVITYVHRLTANADVGPANIYSASLKYWLPMMQLSLFKLIVIGAGLMLFIIPGVFLAVRFSLAEQHLVLRGTNVIDALRASWTMTAPNFLVIFVVLGNLLLLHLLYEYSSTFAPDILDVVLFPLGILIASFSTIAAYRIYALISAPS